MLEKCFFVVRQYKVTVKTLAKVSSLAKIPRKSLCKILVKYYMSLHFLVNLRDEELQLY